MNTCWVREEKKKIAAPSKRRENDFNKPDWSKTSNQDKRSSNQARENLQRTRWGTICRPWVKSTLGSTSGNGRKKLKSDSLGHWLQKNQL